MSVKLKVGKKYTKNEIEIAFNTDFGARIKGITLRNWHDGHKYIILFSRVEGPYGDRKKGEYFYYDGEGLHGDQKLTIANKALVDAIIDERPIFGFVQDQFSDDWEYAGNLKVIDYEYVEKGGRKVYEYKMKIRK